MLETCAVNHLHFQAAQCYGSQCAVSAPAQLRFAYLRGQQTSSHHHFREDRLIFGGGIMYYVRTA